MINILSKKKDKFKETIKDFLKDSFLDKPKFASKIFTKNNNKPSDLKIETVSEKLTKPYNQKESYRILAKDIIMNFTDSVEEISCVIEDAFCDHENNEEKTNYDVNIIYTKQNIKPTKSSIINVSKKLISIFNKYIIDEELSDYNDFIRNHYFKICDMKGVSQADYMNEQKLIKNF